MAQSAVFAIHDSTTYRNLVPIAESVSASFDVEFLLLDRLFDEPGVPAAELTPFRRASDFVRGEWVLTINQRTRPGPFPVAVFQRALDDKISPEISFRLGEYLRKADPDLFVCGHDRLPFVKHVIRECYERDIPTAVVQHGIQRLEHLRSDSWLLNAARPTSDPRWQRLEDLKRRLFYNYGAYIFCNPFVDAVYTIGDFFTEQIERHRSEYPCFGNADVHTTGYPEYGLTDITPYDPEIESGLFLSGWEYEAGEWGVETEALIRTRLKNIEELNDVDIVVRPHPKDSDAKIKRFYSDFERSDGSELRADIDRHDLIVSTYSTAMLLAAAKGKVCGVLQVPWEQNRFGPFEDEHVLELTGQNPDIRKRAARRSIATQRQYLRRYCYVPPIHNGTDAGAPAEFIATLLTDLVHD